MVTTLSAVTGSSVEAGQEILHITDLDRVWVIADVPESESDILRNLKQAELENGMTVLVPLFIAEGEVVRVNVATGKYVERVREGKR